MTNKFEIGSQWKTRGGWRAVVVVDNGESLNVWHSSAKDTYTHKKNGKYRYYCGNDYDLMSPWNDYDLISPWEEPREGKVWVNIYEDQDGNIYAKSTDYLDIARVSGLKQLDRVKVEWREGQFDE